MTLLHKNPDVCNRAPPRAPKKTNGSSPALHAPPPRPCTAEARSWELELGVERGEYGRLCYGCLAFLLLHPTDTSPGILRRIAHPSDPRKSRNCWNWVEPKSHTGGIHQTGEWSGVENDMCFTGGRLAGRITSVFLLFRGRGWLCRFICFEGASPPKKRLSNYTATGRICNDLPVRLSGHYTKCV